MTQTAPLLGCIADDFTGATDLAAMLVRNGMRAVQLIGVPDANTPVPDTDAIIIALKSRTAPIESAVAESRAALDWLQKAGCRQFFFKYCSTFDSTEDGNIGPVADALMRTLGASMAIACPAFPVNGRTVYQGHLFVGAALLHESGMENHPLTPMRDANLVRALGRQTEHGVGLVPYATVEQGETAIRRALTQLREQGRHYAIVDALHDGHLRNIGAAVADHPLVTGGSGIAMELPGNFRRKGMLPAHENAATLPHIAGHGAIIAGSCSRATLYQIGAARGHLPTLELDPLADPNASRLIAQALSWADEKLGETPILIASSAAPEKIAALQSKMGRDTAGALIETALAAIADGLVARGVRRLIVAGGETSGAVVSRLGVQSLRIGPEIDPGVPWTHAQRSAEDPGLLLALKSGNFGARDFFSKAFGMLP